MNVSYMHTHTHTRLFPQNRFSDDIELMTGSRPNMYWLICWKYVAPLAMSGILLASIVEMAVSGAGYEAWDAATATKMEKEWPAWCKILIGVLISASAMWIPLVALLRFDIEITTKQQSNREIHVAGSVV